MPVAAKLSRLLSVLSVPSNNHMFTDDMAPPDAPKTGVSTSTYKALGSTVQVLSTIDHLGESLWIGIALC